MKKILISLIGLLLIGITSVNTYSAIPENCTSAYQTSQNDSSREISYSDLPDAVQKTLKADKYSDWSIIKIYKVTKTDGTVSYSVTFNENGKKVTINFDKDGNEM